MKYTNLYLKDRSKIVQYNNILRSRKKRENFVENQKFKDTANMVVESRDLLYFYTRMNLFHPVINKICHIYTPNYIGTPLIRFTRAQCWLGVKAPSEYFSDREALCYGVNAIAHGYLDNDNKRERVKALLKKPLSSREYKEMALVSLAIYHFNKGIKKDFCHKELQSAFNLFDMIESDRTLLEVSKMFQCFIMIMVKDFSSALEIIQEVEDIELNDINYRIEEKLMEYTQQYDNVYYMYKKAA